MVLVGNKLYIYYFDTNTLTNKTEEYLSSKPSIGPVQFQRHVDEGTSWANLVDIVKVQPRQL